MRAVRHAAVFPILALACSVALHAGQAADDAPHATRLTPAEQEAFLREARVVRSRTIGTGITASRRATLTLGDLTHEVHIQTVDIYRPVFEAGRATELDFHDSYRYNIAGYRLARLLGLPNVPVSIERTFDNKAAAFTWWVDDVIMDEAARAKEDVTGPDPLRFRQQMQIMNVFDELIQNRDRNRGNVLWTADWTLWMIDHTRAFRTGNELLRPERLVHCDRALLDRLRALTRDDVRTAMGRTLNGRELGALMARRDLIVAHYDERIAAVGEGGVLFTLRSLAASTSGDVAPVTN